jgi:hypothetical protein
MLALVMAAFVLIARMPSLSQAAPVDDDVELLPIDVRDLIIIE